MGMPKLDAGPQKSVRCVSLKVVLSEVWFGFCWVGGGERRTCRAEVGEDGAGADFGIEG